MTTKKQRRKQKRRSQDDPMKFVGYGIKGIVGVTALTATANALKEINT